MDPKANLKRQLEIARSIQQRSDAGDETVPTDLADELAQLVLDLDEWQRKGGFSPYEKRVVAMRHASDCPFWVNEPCTCTKETK